MPTPLLITFPALMMAAVMLRLNPWLRAALFAVLIAGELTLILGVTVWHMQGQIIAFAG